MRRFISLLFILVVFAGLGLVIYAYVADLPAPLRTVDAPAAGVGFEN